MSRLLLRFQRVCVQSVCDSKRIIRDTYKQVLHDINEKETVLLTKRRATDEHKNAIQAFRDSRKAKM
jgi:hypothetical protein